jgi:hypothetical protein
MNVTIGKVLATKIMKCHALAELQALVFVADDSSADMLASGAFSGHEAVGVGDGVEEGLGLRRTSGSQNEKSAEQRRRVGPHSMYICMKKCINVHSLIKDRVPWLIMWPFYQQTQRRPKLQYRQLGKVVFWAKERRVLQKLFDFVCLQGRPNPRVRDQS